MSTFPCILYFFDKYTSSSVSQKIVLLSIVIGCLFFCIAFFLKTKIIPIAIAFIIIIPSLILISSFLISGGLFKRSDYDVIFATNLGEANEFVVSFFNYKFLLLISIYIIPVLYMLVMLFKLEKPSLSIIKKSIMTIIIILFVLFILKGSGKKIGNKYYVIDFYKSYLAFINNDKYNQWIKKKNKLNYDYIVKSDLKIKGTKTFVVIIGESLSKSHMQLYGYSRETNPLLFTIRNDLFIFHDVISPAVTTIDALMYALTFAKYGNTEPFFEKPSIINLFNSAGYKTIWISNQCLQGNRNNITHGVLAQECQQVYDDNDLTDQIVLKRLSDVINNHNHKDTFIVIHLKGSHTKYSMRYPESFNYFNHSKIPIPYENNYLNERNKQIIDEYDNSVRFNDYIVTSIIEMIKNKNDYSWIIYFSDHGEELFEFRDMFGHNRKNFSRYMCEVPFIVWVSDKYRLMNKDFFQCFNQYVKRPYSTENLIHSISDLSMLRYKDFDASLSLFSKYYKENTRKVYNTSYNEIPPIQYTRSFEKNPKVVTNSIQ